MTLYSNNNNNITRRGSDDAAAARGMGDHHLRRTTITSRKQQTRATMTTKRRPPFLPLSVFLSLATFVIVVGSTSSFVAVSSSSRQRRQDDENFLRYLQDSSFCSLCTERLERSDADGDGALNMWEYLALSHEHGLQHDPIGNTTLTRTPAPEDMPLELVAQFNLYACSCTLYEDNKSCCVGEDAAIPLSMPNDTAYPCRVCSSTQDTVDDLNNQDKSVTSGDDDDDDPNIFNPRNPTPSPITAAPTTTFPTETLFSSASPTKTTVPTSTASPTIITTSSAVIPTTSSAPTSSVAPTMTTPLFSPSIEGPPSASMAPSVSTAPSAVTTTVAPSLTTSTTTSEEPSSLDFSEEPSSFPSEVPSTILSTSPSSLAPSTSKPILSPPSDPILIQVEYNVTAPKGADQNFVLDLMAAMDILAPRILNQDVQKEENNEGNPVIVQDSGDDPSSRENEEEEEEEEEEKPSLGGRHPGRMLRAIAATTTTRLLQQGNMTTPTSSPTTTNNIIIKVDLPTWIFKMDEYECEGLSSLLECHVIGSGIHIMLLNQGGLVVEDEDEFVSNLTLKLEAAIKEGELSAALQQVNPNAEVSIIDDNYVFVDDNSSSEGNEATTNNPTTTQPPEVSNNNTDDENDDDGWGLGAYIGFTMIGLVTLGAIYHAMMSLWNRCNSQKNNKKDWYSGVGLINSNNNPDGTNTAEKSSEDVLGDSLVRRALAAIEEENIAEEESQATASAASKKSSSSKKQRRRQQGHEDESTQNRSLYTSEEEEGTRGSSSIAMQEQEDLFAQAGTAAVLATLPEPKQLERKSSRQASYGDSGGDGAKPGWVTDDLSSSGSSSSEESGDSYMDLLPPSAADQQKFSSQSSPSSSGGSLNAPSPNRSIAKDSQEWSSEFMMPPPQPAQETSGRGSGSKFLGYPEKKSKKSRAAKLVLAQSSDDDVPCYEDTGSDTEGGGADRMQQHWNATADIFIPGVRAGKTARDSGIPGIHILDSSSASTSSNEQEPWEETLPLPKASSLHHKADAAAGGTPVEGQSLFQMATAPSQSKRKMIYRASKRRTPSKEEIMDELGPVG